jgi:hypothetical protein
MPDDSWEETPSEENPVIETLHSEVQGSAPEDTTGLKYGSSKDSPNKVVPVANVRGRHVGAKALALVSRFPIVGLKWLRASEEFVIYDNQPPPSGEYVVQSLGITTIEYDGVKQNHLLVSFKAGQMSGFGMEDNYMTHNVLLGVVSDYAVDVKTLLNNRNGRTIVINYNRNLVLKVNDTTANQIQLFAVQSPYIIDMGLNIHEIYITTTEATKVKIEAW